MVLLAMSSFTFSGLAVLQFFSKSFSSLVTIYFCFFVGFFISHIIKVWECLVFLGFGLFVFVLLFVFSFSHSRCP